MQAAGWPVDGAWVLTAVGTFQLDVRPGPGQCPLPTHTLAILQRRLLFLYKARCLAVKTSIWRHGNIGKVFCVMMAWLTIVKTMGSLFSIFEAQMKKQQLSKSMIAYWTIWPWRTHQNRCCSPTIATLRYFHPRPKIAQSGALKVNPDMASSWRSDP